MQLSLRGFLVARFVAMLCWLALLAMGYLTYRMLAPHMGNDWLRWLLNLATLAGAILAGNFLQRRALDWLDPEGELRRRVREESETARR